MREDVIEIKGDYPTPDELAAAHDALTRLGRAIFDDAAWAGDRTKAWELVIEAKMRLAQVTNSLGDDYHDAWLKMTGGD